MSAETMDVAVDGKVQWEGTLVGVYSHYGTVNVSEGNVKMNGNKVVGGSFTIDMTTITPEDDNYKPEEGSTPEKLVSHLSSEDFFSVEEYPTATFVITGSSEDGKTLMGDLTVRGVTNPEKVENLMIDADKGTMTGTMVVDRKKYDVTWDHPLQEMVLNDDMQFEITLMKKS
jgi:polyisoprenoid-binding protein YceI